MPGVIEYSLTWCMRVDVERLTAILNKGDLVMIQGESLSWNETATPR